ncbi:2-oxo acid dehydrogenase subunit E2 [Rhodococcus sp. 1R11]|uniref:dihydrolipoamide acetyltransferase family protein n=1 Tax=Rhodococcus sp. 1R11 TaxID=2559614 RepID=UPI0010728B42|nr:dihydrolipoamide acetyltransferase family protein [Rhodococcus sp. 1R11]TFI42466.1 2-oxo acid dehydrogenase subunit E2 [Rhodococcus sp. 1R11]
MSTVIRMPQLAAGGAEAGIQAWLVQPGDSIEAGQPIAEIETEKAVVEYESEVTGTFAGTLVDAGEQVEVGAPIAVVAGQGESVEAALAANRPESAGAPELPTPAVVPQPPEPETAPESASSAAPPVVSAADIARSTATAPNGVESVPSATSGRRLFVTPLVRRLAAERGVDVAAVPGTGPNGRVTRRDFEKYIAAGAKSVYPAVPPKSVPATPATAVAPAPTARLVDPETGFTDIPHTGMRRAIARRLTESKSTVPHFYLVADMQVDELLGLRARLNEASPAKISVNDLVLKAVAAAFTDVPDANAIWTDSATRRFDSVDLAVAVSVPNGLLTPVIRGADSLSIGALAAAVRDLAERARDGKIKQHELEGGSFAVSNLGMYGISEFAAIINPPHSGILAVGAASNRAIVTESGELSVGKMITVTLSADHRVLDGALAAEWLRAFVQRIENPLSIML